MTIGKSLAIVALARDCEKSLRNNIPKIEKLRSFFKTSLVVVMENDSKDKTKAVLSEWRDSAENVIIISKDYYTHTIPQKSADCPFPSYSKQRIQKLCMYRNLYMDYLQNSNIKIDYMMEMDIDIDDFYIGGIVDSVKNAPSGWTALFANGVKYIYLYKSIPAYYYDGYPLIMTLDDQSGLSLTLKEMQKEKGIVSKALKNNDYAECVSAFGGIGIYKYEYIRENRYYAMPNTRSKIVESLNDHISMNYPLYRKMPGTLYIAKKMKVYYEKVPSVKELLISFLPFSLFIFLYTLLKRKEFPV
jgi:hypothetical protein